MHTNGSVVGNIGMVDLSEKLDCWGFERIVGGKSDVNVEDAAFVWSKWFELSQRCYSDKI